jgi:hypothetical protein
MQVVNPDTGTIRRLVAMLVSVAGLAFHKLLGIELDSETQLAIAAIVSGWLIQSGYKEASAKKAEADIKTREDAIKVLRGEGFINLKLLLVLVGLCLGTLAFGNERLTAAGVAPEAAVLPVLVGAQVLVDVQPIEAGEVAPAEGCFLTSEGCIALARRVKACELEREQLRQGEAPPWVAVLLGASVALLAGGVGGYWLASRNR